MPLLSLEKRETYDQKVCGGKKQCENQNKRVMAGCGCMIRTSYRVRVARVSARSMATTEPQRTDLSLHRSHQNEHARLDGDATKRVSSCVSYAPPPFPSTKSYHALMSRYEKRLAMFRTPPPSLTGRLVVFRGSWRRVHQHRYDPLLPHHLFLLQEQPERFLHLRLMRSPHENSHVPRAHGPAHRQANATVE